MKTMRTMVAMLAATASCSKDPGDGGKGEPRDVDAVKVAISYPSSTAFRSVGDVVADQDPMELVTADIFFTDGTGLIIKHVGVGNSNGSIQFTLKDVKDGNAVVKNMTEAAVKCYIVANYAPAAAPIEKDLAKDLDVNITTVLAKTMSVNDINDPEGSVKKLPLYGEGTVTFVNPDKSVVNGEAPDGTKYGGIVQVTLNSLASRLQIGKITARDFEQTEPQDHDDNPDTPDQDVVVRRVEIREFEVEGIYLNYFYSSEELGSKGPEQASFVNSEQNPAKYLSTVAPYVATGVADMMHDNPDDGEAAKDEDNSDVLTLLPAAVDPAPEAKTKVWAYNVLPGATPHIVVRFSKVVVKDSYEQPSDPGEPEVLTTLTGPDKPLFITVRGFLNGESEKITSFAVNNVYTLGDIAFDRSDLSEIPEDESLNVVVNVEMLKWKDNPITWDKD